MNCGTTPAETGKSAHVDHIKARSLYPELELELHNMQVLCETCNCSIKGIYTVDYRNDKHIALLESATGKKTSVICATKQTKKRRKPLSPEEAERRAAQRQLHLESRPDDWKQKKKQQKRKNARERKEQVKFLAAIRHAQHRGFGMPRVMERLKEQMSEERFARLVRQSGVKHLLDVT